MPAAIGEVPADPLGQGRAFLSAGDVRSAFALWQAAAASGDAACQVELARALLFGVGVDPDPHQALHWLARAEAQGNLDAALLLVQVSAGNTLLPCDEVIAERLLRGVQARHPLALRAVGVLFSRDGTDAAQRMATRLFEAAARRGDPISTQLFLERLSTGVISTGDAVPGVGFAAGLAAQLAASGVAALPRTSPRSLTATPAGVDAGPARLDIEAFLSVPAPLCLSERPVVQRLDGLLCAEECRLLMALAAPLLRGSQVVDPDSGEGRPLLLRTSHDAQFDVLLEDPALRLVQARMARAAGLPLAHAEPLIVLRYEPGQEYRPHRDYLGPEAIARDRPEAGNRLRSLCVYLNDVDAGGATEFQRAGLRVEPRAGDAVLFDNLLPDGSPDTESLHAGLPVERGVKWLATLWFRERAYRYF